MASRNVRSSKLNPGMFALAERASISVSSLGSSNMSSWSIVSERHVSPQALARISDVYTNEG